MKEGIREAPFTDDEVRILKLWQENDFLHLFTCCDHENMLPTNEGMKCLKCSRIQEWVHDFMLKESAATYNPFKNAKFTDEDVSYKDELKHIILNRIKDLEEKIKTDEPMPEKEQDIDFLVEVDDALEEILHHFYY